MKHGQQQRGQTTVEYLLIISVIMIGVTLFGVIGKGMIGTISGAVFSSVPQVVAKLQAGME